MNSEYDYPAVLGVEEGQDVFDQLTLRVGAGAVPIEPFLTVEVPPFTFLCE